MSMNSAFRIPHTAYRVPRANMSGGFEGEGELQAIELG